VSAASPLPNMATPAPLPASLIARLDRLGSIAKEVAQIGAVLGREYGYDLIEQVARRPDAELRMGLDRLAGAGLLFCRGIPPQSPYPFQPPLGEGPAAPTLLRAKRRGTQSRV